MKDLKNKIDMLIQEADLDNSEALILNATNGDLKELVSKYSNESLNKINILLQHIMLETCGNVWKAMWVFCYNRHAVIKSEIGTRVSKEHVSLARLMSDNY